MKKHLWGYTAAILCSIIIASYISDYINTEMINWSNTEIMCKDSRGQAENRLEFYSKLLKNSNNNADSNRLFISQMELEVSFLKINIDSLKSTIGNNENEIKLQQLLIDDYTVIITQLRSDR